MSNSSSVSAEFIKEELVETSKSDSGSFHGFNQIAEEDTSYDRCFSRGAGDNIRTNLVHHDLMDDRAKLLDQIVLQDLTDDRAKLLDRFVLQDLMNDRLKLLYRIVQQDLMDDPANLLDRIVLQDLMYDGAKLLDRIVLQDLMYDGAKLLNRIVQQNLMDDGAKLLDRIVQQDLMYNLVKPLDRISCWSPPMCIAEETLSTSRSNFVDVGVEDNCPLSSVFEISLDGEKSVPGGGASLGFCGWSELLTTNIVVRRSSENESRNAVTNKSRFVQICDGKLVF